ncbi:RNA polymerase sigma-70 factor (sigma-E family) [Lentzea atacamensis]|uniref:RNA polymerase sigma-70 factor (Sigma-E family) n=1 Tax=Lentzea atacamensis TaxID=531938 RepID=A0A316HL54_9PSEU|nr:SigE family RNA polymerase sigma factor [Lentzea atacamensis]PWK80711.1 RNA polymerase sigma-70 factor (sigma-E family) [Lentzea atacamensis]
MRTDSSNESAFAEFTSTKADSLLRAAWLLTGDPHKAEDLLQTVLVKLWQRWDRLDNADAYARRMLYSTYLSWWRRRWRYEVPTAALPDVADGHEMETVVVLRASVCARLAQLSKRQRAVIALRFWDDLSVEATAAVLGCSVGSVKTHTARALAVLRADEVLGGIR